MDSTDVEVLLGLQLSGVVGSILYQRLLSCFRSHEAIRKATRPQLAAIEGIGTAKAAAIEASFRRHRAERELDLIRQSGISLLSCLAPDYPGALRVAFDYPLILTVCGALAPVDRRAIAVVGTRRPSSYGRRQARRFARALAKSNVTIVSGLARGIDTEAHGAALESGRTIAVLGCGLKRVYPPENESLARAIAERGAVVSEFPIEEPAHPAHFPRRNRLISALSLGTLLVEGSLTSGALITCDWALEQGKPVFCLPGDVENPLAKGPHALIRQGAILVEEPADVFEELPDLGVRGVLSAIERLVLRALPGHLDSIVRVTRLQRRVAERILNVLVSRGLLHIDGSKRYTCKATAPE